jgi:ribonuclease P protein component
VVVARFRNSAVARNKLRRQLREITRRRILPNLTPIDLVIRAQAESYRRTFEDLANEIEQWFASFEESLGRHST